MVVALGVVVGVFESAFLGFSIAWGTLFVLLAGYAIDQVCVCVCVCIEERESFSMMVG